MKKKLLWLWNNIERIVLLTLFILILLTVFVQIVSRWVLPEPLFFTEELARSLYILMVFCGFSWVTKERTELRLDVVAGRIKGKAKTMFDFIVNIICLVIFVYLSYWAIQYTAMLKLKMMPALQFSMAYIHGVSIIAMGLSAVRTVVLIIGDIKDMCSWGKKQFDIKEE